MLFVAVLGMGASGPLVRFSDAHPLTIAAWRLAFAVAIIAVLRALSGGTRPHGREWGAALLAGLFLALHFWAWNASVQLTTVASSVALVCMQPVFVAIFSALFLHEHATRAQWTGIVVAVAGAFVIAWGDWGMGRDALIGDALALLGAVLVSVYYVIGRRLRQRLDLWTYTGVVYGAAAVLLFALALASGAELLHHPRREWLIFGLLALLPTMLGHTGANYALAHYRAYMVNLAILGEPVIATLLAWGLPGIRETPPIQTVVGGVLVVGGIAWGTLRGARRYGDAPMTQT
ncbi:MAG TPA: DMT family transporter [Longimicrobiales bacterium]